MADEGQPGTGNIAARLARIWLKVETLPHDGRVEGGFGSRSYTYTKVDARKRYFRRLLAEEGLVVIPERSFAKNGFVEIKTKNGTRQVHESHVHAAWRLLASGTDETWELAAEGYSQDSSDKAVNQASTFCVGNLISWVLQLDTGEDPEQSTREAAVEDRKQTGGQQMAPSAPKNPPSRAANDGDARPISNAQVKRLRTLATNGAWPDEALRRVFLAYGVPKGEDGKPSAKSVARGVYEDICTALEEAYPPLEEVRHELDRFGTQAKLSPSECMAAMKQAGVITDTIGEMVGDKDKLIAAMQAITAAADAKAAS